VARIVVFNCRELRLRCKISGDEGWIPPQYTLQCAARKAERPQLRGKFAR